MLRYCEAQLLMTSTLHLYGTTGAHGYSPITITTTALERVVYTTDCITVRCGCSIVMYRDVNIVRAVDPNVAEFTQPCIRHCVSAVFWVCEWGYCYAIYL